MVVLDLANQTKPALYMCLLSLFSRHLFVTNAGTSQRFREWSGYTGVQWGQNHNNFLLHNIKALQGKQLSHPMKLPGNGANSNTTTTPMTAWSKYHRESTMRVNFAMTNPEQSSVGTTTAAGKGKGFKGAQEKFKGHSKNVFSFSPLLLPHEIK